jgi:hypothetical protein
MTFGLDLTDLHGFWCILVGILLVRHPRRVFDKPNRRAGRTNPMIVVFIDRAIELR